MIETLLSNELSSISLIEYAPLQQNLHKLDYPRGQQQLYTPHLMTDT